MSSQPLFASKWQMPSTTSSRTSFLPRWKCPEEQNRDLPILRSPFQRRRHCPRQSEIPRDLPLCCWTVEIWLFLIVKVAQAVKNLPATQEALCSIPGSGSSPGEGNDKPLQYSCLGNPMDGGAWWATVHVVTNPGGLNPQLSDEHFTFTVKLENGGIFASDLMTLAIFLPGLLIFLYV